MVRLGQRSGGYEFLPRLLDTEGKFKCDIFRKPLAGLP